MPSLNDICIVNDFYKVDNIKRQRYFVEQLLLVTNGYQIHKCNIIRIDSYFIYNSLHVKLRVDILHMINQYNLLLITYTFGNISMYVYDLFVTFHYYQMIK